MSTKNYDSSLLTQRRQAKALGGYATALQALIDSPTGQGQFVVRRTQPTTQTATVVLQENLGACYCRTDTYDPANPATYNPYGFNPSGGQCGCGLGPS